MHMMRIAHFIIKSQSLKLHVSKFKVFRKEMPSLSDIIEYLIQKFQHTEISSKKRKSSCDEIFRYKFH